MKARTKIEKQVAASNEKLTVLSPKVSHGQCGKWQDMSASVLPHTSVPVAIVAGTSTIRKRQVGMLPSLRYSLTDKRHSQTHPQGSLLFFLSLEVIDHLQVQRVFRLETTFRKGMPMEVDYWEVCRLWLNAEGKVAVTARAKDIGLLCGLL